MINTKLEELLTRYRFVKYKEDADRYKDEILQMFDVREKELIAAQEDAWNYREEMERLIWNIAMSQDGKIKIPYLFKALGKNQKRRLKFYKSEEDASDVIIAGWGNDPYTCEECEHKIKCEKKYGAKRDDGDDYTAIIGTHFCLRSWDQLKFMYDGG